MHPEQIKAEIRMKGSSFAEIARGIEVDPCTVSQVVSNKGYRSGRIEKAVADFLNKPLHVVFPERYEDPNARAS